MDIIAHLMTVCVLSNLKLLQRLKKEKEALHMTTELLTVRLNSVNEILSLQEEKIVNKVSVHCLVTIPKMLS